MNKTFKEQGIDSFPLCWPAGWKRTTHRTRGYFSKDKSFEVTRRQLFKELKLLGVGDWNVILSTNIPLRKDGMPYSGMANPQDPGVAVYFRHNDKPMVFACDAYVSVVNNLYAISLTIEALRGIKRWGASDMMERSFAGFTALPAPKPAAAQREWWTVMELPPSASQDAIKARYRLLAQVRHPDAGGTHDTMAELNRAYAEATRT